ncbi:MAG: type transport system ATP-binding protein [Bacteroidota bacterium]|nr:type transport system ATP-binding protein [Bacteroidota bacterium]
MVRDIIELSDLTKKYGSFAAVDNLNLTIRKGEIFGLLGPNGAGKSTTILMMLGLTDPTSGSVKVCGIDSTSNPIEVKKKVGYLPEDIGFYDDCTGLENLMFTARLNRIPYKEAMEKADLLLGRVGLSDEVKKKTGKYSRGMRQRLGLADVLIKDPEVIILDEPTLGIDPRGVQEFLELIVQLKKEKELTVLLCSHHLHQMQQVCDRVGLFVKGKLIAEGDINSLSQKLFSARPFTIEAGISSGTAGVSDSGSKVFNEEQLTDTLKKISGVLSVNLEDNVFQIGCSHNAAAEIAKVIVESGAGLNFLYKKEYGLNEIYNRYFEGGEEYE